MWLQDNAMIQHLAVVCIESMMNCFEDHEIGN